MPLKRRIGYDTHILFSRQELAAMYMKEGGMTKEMAEKKAAQVYASLNSMRAAEQRLWAKVRDNELTDGLEPEPLEKFYAVEDL